MLNEGVGSWPYRRIRLSPAKTAITYRDQKWTYGQLDARSSRLAHALRAHGVERGDRVALLSPNHPCYLETLFACGLLGAIFVPLNARLAGREIAYCLQDSGATLVIHSAGTTEHAVAASESTDVRQRVVVDGEPDAAALSYEDIIGDADGSRIDEAVQDTDPCLIMYTSGTTGHPKGVVLSHRTILFAVLNPVIDLDLTSDEVALVCAPLFHTAALDFVSLPTLLKGGTVHIEEGFDPGRVLTTIEKSRVSYMFAVPTMYDQISDHPRWNSTDLSTLRRAVVAAAPVPPQTLRAYTQRGVRLCQAYGLTETGPGALILTPENVEHKLGTAGVPHFFTDVRVVDETGNSIPPGNAGEIQISGPNVMTCYWNRPEDTADAFTEQTWLRSGDIGVSDEDGYIAIVDRVKDMIISGGENVYPAEVESAIMEITGVLDCAVFGVPDARWGEAVRAALTLQPGCTLSEEDARQALRERLAKYKIPKTVLFLPEIPRNASGKIRKHELRNDYAN